MLKLVLFDLDGVLVDTREHHYLALNRALEELDPKYAISLREHAERFDGLSTQKKLEVLSLERGLPTEAHASIWQRKQEHTFAVFAEHIKPNPVISALFKQLKSDGLKIYICSNSIRETVKRVLLHMQLMEYVDAYISNQDVISAKPHPEMYWQAMIRERVLPQQTLIIEDSFVGRSAALSSGARVLGVKNPDDVTTENVYRAIAEPMHPGKWVDDTLQVVIPMSGAGSRFVNAGFTFPKPLISIDEKPMIQLVVDNLGLKAQFIFIVRRDHYETYHLESMLKIIAPGCRIILTDGVTEGACCSTLLAEQYIDNQKPLLIANSDQFIEWESGAFFHAMNAPHVDGGILTFQSTHPKWSYVQTDSLGNVSLLREKEVISQEATVGIYYWQRGADYVRYAKNMIAKNLRVNGEFYVAPVYNEAIADGMQIKTYTVNKMWGLGTPEDLDHFLKHRPDLQPSVRHTTLGAPA